MPTLFETLQQNLGQQAQPVPGAGGQQTQTVADILRAKQGQVGGMGGGARASSLAATSAAQQTQTQGAQQAISGQLEGQQFQQQNVDEKRQYAIQAAQIESKRQSMVQQAQIKTDQIMQEAQQQGRQLTFDQDANKLEELGFNLRLQDKQYVSQLQIQGAKQRLNDANSFKMAMAQTQFGDNYDTLKNKLDFNKVMSDNENDFLSQMQNIDVNAALEMADNAAKQANQQALYQGIGGLVTGGVKAAGAMSGPSTTTTTNTTSTPDIYKTSTNPAVENNSSAWGYYREED